jgi:P4 family phage/plasmid primase-like protien
MNASINDFPSLDNEDDAKRFLDALGSGDFHFRTIPEAPGNQNAARKHKGFDPTKIARENRSGSGVFVVVNEGGDADNNITLTRAVFLDIDRKEFISDKACGEAIRYAHEGRKSEDEPIPMGWPHASMCVKSGGGGAHLYWLTDGCPVDKFKRVQQKIAERFSGDPTVCNPSRVMRLPGTLHCKSGKPVPVTLAVCKPERRYQLDDLLQRLGVEISEETPQHLTLQLGVNSRPKTPETISALQDALVRLDARYPDAVNDRATWLKVLTSIVAHGWGETGRAIANEWSSQSPKYDESRFAVDWRSIKPEGGITPSTVYWLAGPDLKNDCPDMASDDGIACRFKSWLGGRVMFARGQFHLWTGSYWRPDRTAVESLLKDYAKEYDVQASEKFRSDPENNFGKHQKRAALNLFSVPKQKTVLDSLRVILSVPSEQLDHDIMLLSLPNGLMDLRTGELLDSDPLAYCTLSTSVPYDAEMKCPTWLHFLDTIFGRDADVIAFVHRWMGYCLTGSMVEEKLLFGYGTGANGKSVLANVQQYIMGRYAVTADASLLMGSRQNAGSATPQLMPLVGARLCLLNESKTGDRLDDGVVKKLVSTEQMVGRANYGDIFAFTPSAKLFLRSNHRPVVRDETDGLWRRLMLLPFPIQVPTEQQDHDLFEKLKAEGPAILALAVKGCLEWQKVGLKPPRSISEATDTYRSDSDAIADWLDSRTEGGGYTPTQMLLSDYVRYAQIRHPPSPKAFAMMLTERKFDPHRNGQSRGFKITLKPEDI